MEIFRLDKAIDNEKLDLEMGITQLKKVKSNSLNPWKEEKILQLKWMIISTLKKELKTFI